MNNLPAEEVAQILPGVVEKLVSLLLDQNAGMNNLYEVLMSKVEPTVLEAAMRHVKHNKSQCAKMLGISRGTLRKKLAAHSKLATKVVSSNVAASA